MKPPKPPEPQLDLDLRGMTHVGDPETSLEAAEAVGQVRRVIQRRVLDLLRRGGPMTDHELHVAYCLVYGTAAYVTPAKRRGELRDLGLVEDTGERRPVPTTGHRAVVWRAVASPTGGPAS